MTDVIALDGEWKQVKIGAGGWVTGIDISADGTMVARTDTAGAYLWDGTKWVELVTAYSMPDGTGQVSGVYEIRIAPSDSNILYMEASGGLYKSIDQGTTWIKTSFPNTFMDANWSNRMDGQKMAIDPNNPDIVYAGTQQNGLWVTRDGGVTWQQITAVPQGTNTDDPGLTGIVIYNNTIYVGTAGSGVYRSEDSGQSWERIPGGPIDVSFAVVSPTGELYVTGNSDTALWKYADGVWTKLIDNYVQAVAIDPFNPMHIVAVSPGGTLRESDDGGATWSEWAWRARLESSDEIPWLEDSGQYMSAGGFLFDPITPNTLYQSAGVGVWSATLPDQLRWDTQFTWNSMSAGIENVVPNDIIAPPGGNPVFASWDRAFFELADVDSYATEYSGGDFSMGWSLDYASTDPSFVVGLSDWWGQENSGFSTDGGKTWQKFEGLPSFAWNTIGGSIAASTPTNFIWVPAGDAAPAYTLDGGKTWTSINIDGIVNWTGFAYFLKRSTITADRVDENTFYLYDTYSGVYVTKDGGVNWTKVFDGQISPWSYWNAKIEAVPGRAGELFFTSGNQSGDPSVPADISFMRSTDGGATWQAVAGVEEVTTFGYGAAKVEGGPATIFIVGFVNDVYGVWFSTDNAQSWTQIGSQPMGNLDEITTISGDMDEFGVVYVGIGGSGYVYLSINDLSIPLPDPVTPIPSSETIDPVDAGDNGGTVNAPPHGAPEDVSAGSGPQAGAAVTDDFNGDGHSDILWRNTDGTLSDWLGLPNGGFSLNDTNAAITVDTAWQVVGTGDFNGDGRSDILWRNADGTLSNWLGTAIGGFTPNDANAAAAVSNAWQVAGTGDFNGDGRDDVLWRNADGLLSNWLGKANGGFVANDTNAATAVTTAWQVAATGDFNGDGRSDILWRNDDGQLSNWLGLADGGFSSNDANAATSVSTAWQVTGTGDFNGDGRDDILWRNVDGQLSNWLGTASGGFMPNNANAATTVPLAWTVVATGDYNGDGRDDILWRHEDGTLSNWLGTASGGFVANDANAAATVSISWNAVPADTWI